METSWLQSSATVTFLLQQFTRTSLGCILLKLGNEIFHSGIILAWTEGSLRSLFWGAETKIYMYKYIFLFKGKKKKPNPQPPNPFHHFTSPVLIKTCLGLRACYPHKFCHCPLGEGLFVHGTKCSPSLGSSAPQRCRFQIASVGSGCQNCTLQSL